MSSSTATIEEGAVAQLFPKFNKLLSTPIMDISTDESLDVILELTKGIDDTELLLPGLNHPQTALFCQVGIQILNDLVLVKHPDIKIVNARHKYNIIDFIVRNHIRIVNTINVRIKALNNKEFDLDSKKSIVTSLIVDLCLLQEGLNDYVQMPGLANTWDGLSKFMFKLKPLPYFVDAEALASLESNDLIEQMKVLAGE